MNLTNDNWQEWRAAILTFASDKRACFGALNALKSTTTMAEAIDVVMSHQAWLSARSYDIGPLPAGCTIGGDAYLRGYAHPLPAGCNPTRIYL